MKRTFSRPIKRIVVKLGSSQIADGKMQPKTAQLRALAEQIKELRRRKIDVVLVSSGAIVLGMGELGEKKRPTILSQLQARAAIGQTVLMHTYTELFKDVGLKCAQVLLTHEDFNHKLRYNNAENTLNAILEKGIIPIINENDTISTEEIKFGDNDKLSALTACLIDASLLVILSDVEGFYDQDKRVFQEVAEITPSLRKMATGTSNIQVARGGMAAKLDAIQMVGHAKIPCVITAGSTENVLVRLIDGENLGTLFREKEKKVASHKHWIAFVATSKGVLRIDDGAKQALMNGKSLLLPGIKSFEGDFKHNDVVEILDTSNGHVGRGIVNYSASALKDQNKKVKEIIHRDHLVLGGWY